MKELRIGIVGCGGIAREHVRGYLADGHARVVAVHDPVPAAAQRLAEETGARATRSPAEMIARDALDAVSVCSPPAAHPGNCAPFLRAGIAVLCEKPLAANAAQARRLAALVRRTRTLFMPAFCHRFHPPILEMKRLIERGVLGRAILFRNIFGGWLKLNRTAHRADPRVAGGGCLIDNGCHSVDLFRFLVGEPVRVSAMIGNVDQPLAVEDFSVLHLAARPRGFGEITSSYSFRSCRNLVEWYGTCGTAVVSYGNLGFHDLSYQLEGQSDWTPVDCSARPDRFVAEVGHFLACLRRRRKPSVTAADGLRANLIIDACYRSARTGRACPVTL